MLPKITIYDIADTTDAVFTKLSLMDYDWLEYDFSATIHTRDNGIIHMAVEYVGTTECRVYVEQSYANDVKYQYDENLKIADMVIEFIKTYETVHAESLGTFKAFDNTQITIDFYNKIIPLLTNEPIIESAKNEND